MDANLSAIASPLIAQKLMNDLRRAFPIQKCDPAANQLEREQQIYASGCHYVVEWIEKNCVQRSVNGHDKS